MQANHLIVLIQDGGTGVAFAGKDPAAGNVMKKHETDAGQKNLLKGQLRINLALGKAVAAGADQLDSSADESRARPRGRSGKPCNGS